MTGKDKDIYKIVITGGPCAGKTTALEQVKDIFERIGYKVLIVSETATELISSGVSTHQLESVTDYQLCQISLQIKKEEVFVNAASKVKNADKVIVICDRGVLDSKAYMTEAEFKQILDTLNLNENEICDSYGAVFHLETAAKGAKQFYTLNNNSARTESAEEAIKVDDRLISAWKDHRYFRLIDNSTDFDTKINRLIDEIASFIGVQNIFEIERKFLIEYPDISQLETLCHGNKSDITQWYITNESGEMRIRRREEKDGVTYYKTIKKEVEGAKRIEIESIISKEEFATLLESNSLTENSISKIRYCIDYKGHCFEIDIYPFWRDKAVLEIELNAQNEKFDIPLFVKIIKEVTGDKRYNNFSLAKSSGII